MAKKPRKKKYNPHKSNIVRLKSIVLRWDESEPTSEDGRRYIHGLPVASDLVLLDTYYLPWHFDIRVECRGSDGLPYFDDYAVTLPPLKFTELGDGIEKQVDQIKATINPQHYVNTTWSARVVTQQTKLLNKEHDRDAER